MPFTLRRSSGGATLKGGESLRSATIIELAATLAGSSTLSASLTVQEAPKQLSLRVGAAPERLAVSITGADGHVTRWGPDEPDPANLPQGLSFSTSIPGGFKDLTCELPRRIDFDYGDLNLFDSIRVYGAGNETAWEGRQAQFPRNHGDEFAIQVGAVGHAAHLRDDPSFREIYVDRDPSAWHDPPFSRKLAIANASQGQGKIPASVVLGGLVWDLPAESIPDEELSELHYDCGPGLGVDEFGYIGQRTGAFTNFETPQLRRADSEDHLTGAVGTALTLDNTLRVANIGQERYIMLRVYCDTGPQTPGSGWQQRYSALAVYGKHGLDRQAIDSTTPDGHFLSDIVADVVGRAAPLLRFTTGSGGSIEAHDFIVPHAVFKRPTTAEEALKLLNGFALWEWGVYDGRTFFFRRPDPGRLTWEARLSEGAHLVLEGDQAEDVYNGVIVHYRDPGGAEKMVGPPGSGLDAEDASLEDTAADNPVNAHGIPIRWAELQLSEISTQAGAIQKGAVFLAERSLPQRRGQAVLRSTLVHPGLNQRLPVWKVRAGDFLRIPDHPADEPRRIIETRYDHATRTLTCSLDNSVFTLEAILEQLKAELVGTVGGG